MQYSKRWCKVLSYGYRTCNGGSHMCSGILEKWRKGKGKQVASSMYLILQRARENSSMLSWSWGPMVKIRCIFYTAFALDGFPLLKCCKGVLLYYAGYCGAHSQLPVSIHWLKYQISGRQLEYSKLHKQYAKIVGPGKLAPFFRKVSFEVFAHDLRVMLISSNKWKVSTT